MSALGDIDLYLAGEGRHERLYERLGAHSLDDGGVRFAVWAPNARTVSAVGDWNYWSEGADALEPRGSSGIWEGIAASAREGHRYKLAVSGADGITRQKADPFATYAEVPPANASVVYRSRYTWSDEAWLESPPFRRAAGTALLRLRGSCGIVAAGAFLAGARGATRPVRAPTWASRTSS